MMTRPPKPLPSDLPVFRVGNKRLQWKDRHVDALYPCASTCDVRAEIWRAHLWVKCRGAKFETVPALMEFLSRWISEADLRHVTAMAKGQPKEQKPVKDDRPDTEGEITYALS